MLNTICKLKICKNTKCKLGIKLKIFQSNIFKKEKKLFSNAFEEYCFAYYFLFFSISKENIIWNYFKFFTVEFYL